MFYVKLKDKEHDEFEIRIEITDENVFTKCPICGKEHQVDIQEILKDGDLYGTSIFCEECYSKSKIITK